MPAPARPNPAVPGISDRRSGIREEAPGRAVRCAGRMISPMMAGFSRLTAQQVNEQTFARALRGYAMHEVDEFLDRAAEEIARWHEALSRGQRPASRLLTPREVSEAVFNKEMRGYDMAEVDDFLDELAAELARLQSEATRRAAPTGRRLTADDIVRKEFNVAVRGYAMVEVDAFLDELTDELAYLQDQDPQAQYR